MRPMSAQDSEETGSEEQENGPRVEQGDIELSEEGREEVHAMVEAYKDKPTVVLPGSHGTITGTAINDWLDDEGNPTFGDPDEHPFAEDRDDSDDEVSKEEASEEGG